jgi:hypothetical protein
MASRWQARLLQIQKVQREKRRGYHKPFATVEVKGKAMATMPEAKIDTTQLVAEYLSRKSVNKAACKGIMPQGSYGLTMRKAKGGSVPLWTGTDGRPNNAVAAPAGKGMLRNNWSTATEPYLIKRGG